MCNAADNVSDNDATVRIATDGGSDVTKETDERIASSVFASVLSISSLSQVYRLSHLPPNSSNSMAR